QHRDLHAFPTRRSSDLNPGGGTTGPRGCENLVLERGAIRRRWNGDLSSGSLPGFDRGFELLGVLEARFHVTRHRLLDDGGKRRIDRKSTRLNSSHVKIS